MSKKKTWFNLKHIQVSQKTRDSVIDFVKEWSGKTEIPRMNLINWTGISKSKYYNWNYRYGKANKANRETPRDFYLESWEKEKIVFYYLKHQSEGYRRLSFKMVDADVVASSPSTVYRVLKSRGYMNRWNSKPTKKGTGFVQPSRPHEHWHIDITYINVRGTFYYLLTILDGYSRFVVHWEVRECMKESDVEIILQRAHEKFPDETPRIISDNGPQFIAKDFKEFIRVSGMTHVRTAPYYPQSNGNG